jgi:hypothetical protein
MKCEFESDVLSAVIEGRWSATPGELHAHAHSCPVCSEVACLATAFSAARAETQAAAVIPDSGRMWWIAQLRARREAATAAGRPITAAQVIAFACAVGLLSACFGATSTWFQTALRRFAAALAAVDLPALTAGHGLLILLAIGALLLVPAAVCFAMFRD